MGSGFQSQGASGGTRGPRARPGGDQSPRSGRLHALLIRRTWSGSTLYPKENQASHTVMFGVRSAGQGGRPDASRTTNRTDSERVLFVCPRDLAVGQCQTGPVASCGSTRHTILGPKKAGCRGARIATSPRRRKDLAWPCRNDTATARCEKGTKCHQNLNCHQILD